MEGEMNGREEWRGGKRSRKGEGGSLSFTVGRKKRKVGAYERKCADTIDTVLVLGLAISSDKI